MVYLSADLHLGHEAIIRLCKRPFSSVPDMNRTIIQNINSRVHKGDVLYLCGDLTHRIPVEEANELISRLNGDKVLIRGNHDKGYDPALFREIFDFTQFSFAGVRFAAMHYPMVEWPGSFRGSVHVHGHQHNGPEYNVEQRNAGIRRYDVGLDANGFFPVSAHEILQFMGIV